MVRASFECNGIVLVKPVSLTDTVEQVIGTMNACITEWATPDNDLSNGEFTDLILNGTNCEHSATIFELGIRESDTPSFTLIFTKHEDDDEDTEEEEEE